MTDWYEILLLTGILAVAAWLLVRIYLPLRRLNEMIRRVRQGEQVHAWELHGPKLIRQAARALSELSEEYNAIRHSRQRADVQLKQVLSTIEEGVVVVDQAGLIQLANESFKRLFVLEHDLVGKRLREQIQMFEVN
ncbi:MAG: PAS domain-containing protein, partial [Verrucomicrobiota bacterium]